MTNPLPDYSQRGEQAVVLDRLAGVENGRFLDIGAYDGLRFSNTRALAQRGWSGVCVEPAAWAFDRLALLYHDRPDITLVQALVDSRSGGRLVDVSYAAADALTTTEPDHADLWRAAGAHFRHVWMPPLHPRMLLDAFPGPYQLVSIDTERTSVDLLAGIVAACGTLERLGCEVLCVEHDDRHADVAAMCPAFETVWESGENLILARTR